MCPPRLTVQAASASPPERRASSATRPRDSHQAQTAPSTAMPADIASRMPTIQSGHVPVRDRDAVVQLVQPHRHPGEEGDQQNSDACGLLGFGDMWTTLRLVHRPMSGHVAEHAGAVASTFVQAAGPAGGRVGYSPEAAGRAWPAASARSCAAPAK